MERMKASLRRGLSLLLVFMLVIGCASLDFGNPGGLQAFADESSPETILYNYFNGHGKANETPLVFPYGTEAGQYTNATDFIKGESVKVLKDAGIDNITESDISVTATFGGTYGGKVGAGTKYEAVTMDTAGNINPVYAEKATTPKVQNLTIGVNGKEASMIKLLSLSVDPIAVTTQQKVDMEAELLTWDYIKGKNTSIDHVVNPLGKLTGNNAVLSNIKPALFTVVTDSKVGVEIKWALSYTGEGADPKCLELTTKGATVTTTIQRPNVGEADASYRLTATVASKTEPDVKKEVNFDVTVPAFEACTVPFKITPADATLTITDSIFKKPVDDKYITVSPDGLTRTVKLHKSTTDAKQIFEYEVTKAGYLTKKASVTVTGDMPEIEINLTPESAEDTKLSNLGITDPAAGTVSIKQPMAAFDKDTYEYTMKVGAVPSVTIKPETAVAGAGVTVSYYPNASKANSNTLSTKSFSSGGTQKCYLKTSEDDETTTEIVIKVTAPAGSNQEAKTYKLKTIKH